MKTIEELELKADELGKIHGCKVHPLLFDDGNGGQVTGFIKEPQRIVKMRALDKSFVSPVTAASELLDACLIKEESDARIYSEAAENDHIYIGAAMAAMDLVKMSVNQFKKK